MARDFPEYYRHLVEKPSPPSPSPGSKEGAASKAYRGNTFTLILPETWQDHSVYVLAGPVADDLQHTLTISVEQDLPVDSLLDYVDWQLASLEDALQGFQLLKREPVTLNNGMPAYRVVCRWSPIEQRPLYQEHLYLLQEQTGYKLTATFTKKTRRTLGPAVARMMLGFEPVR